MIKHKIFDEERALYALKNEKVEECIFAGPADGESALKECRGIDVARCSFSLRYPLWHTHDFSVTECVLDDKTRAPLWYAENGKISDSYLGGIKTLRECESVEIIRCSAMSPEFGWRCRGLKIENTFAVSEYFLFESRDISMKDVRMDGKYSFQYVENALIRGCFFNTKDAFWHSKNVTVENSVIKGEYLGWYSENLTLINCHIQGTQPLCYCKGLTLVNCTTEGCDLAFEYSDVDADISGHILSVKNPASGRITADSVGEIILENAVTPCNAEIIEKNKK